MSQRTCRSCGEEKILEAFPLFSTVGAGRKTTCKTCSNKQCAVRRKLRKENPPPPPGNCPCCGRQTEQWVLDHCHKTDRFRGYICNACNTGLGKFEDDPVMLRHAISYLLYSTLYDSPSS